MSRPAGPQWSAFVGVVVLGPVAHLDLSVRVYGTGTARCRGILSRRFGRERSGLPLELLNPGRTEGGC